ncbi:MAG: sulfite exporter TauE/SafE family protein [Alphaproteobacteria bacterium]|nr:sulfite exporter TauE/SafE family protein [Alphaproteobacteria bacterium]
MISIADLLSIGSGGIVGFALGLLGGGGSILAVPLLIYVVGLRSTHLAIGTSAFAVAASAFANLVAHTRAGHVKWSCAATFAASGVVGAAAGAKLGQMVDGKQLLFLFGLVMLAVATAMFNSRAADGNPDVRINAEIAWRSVLTGLLAGALSGFFGIGGGFLIVPAIMLGSGMMAINAVGSSLVSVGAFGLTTALSYALAGMVDWRVATLFVLGGGLGGLLGVRLAKHLAVQRAVLTRVFAGVVLVVAGFVLWRSMAAFLA